MFNEFDEVEMDKQILKLVGKGNNNMIPHAREASLKSSETSQQIVVRDMNQLEIKILKEINYATENGYFECDIHCKDIQWNVVLIMMNKLNGLGYTVNDIDACEKIFTLSWDLGGTI